VKESVTEVLAIADTLRFRTVPGRVTVGGGWAVVEAEATFERVPNTALTFSVPRNGTNWKL
jgi:hypothetical protein